jgi:hypothetical protein
MNARYLLRYMIVLRGEIRRLLNGLDGNVQVEFAPCGHTSVVASFRDEPEFWGLLQWFQGLALHVVSLQELDPREGIAESPANAEGAAAAGLPADCYPAELVHLSYSAWAFQQRGSQAFSAQTRALVRRWPDRGTRPAACGLYRHRLPNHEPRVSSWSRRTATVRLVAQPSAD